MKIYHSIDDFKPVANAVVTIGTFDGVHIGHQKIIRRLNEIAKDISGESVVLTFFPHPRMILYPDEPGLMLLNSIEEKKELMKSFGIQHLIIHPFSKEFSRQTVNEYVRDMLVNKIGVKKLVTGSDHHFGHNRQGSLKDLHALGSIYNFDVEEITEQDIRAIIVSSTKIRNALTAGDVVLAREFLGYDYSLTGTVVKGNRMGRELGFPTANILADEKFKLIPDIGIYAVKVKLPDEKIKSENDGRFIGMLSIGTRPTFDNGDISIEVNILNFNKDIYGEKITVYFKQRLRDEMKFISADALIIQMEKDREDTLKLLS